MKTAGADIVISPYAAAGHRIAQSFLRPHLLDFLDITSDRSGTFQMLIEEVKISPKSPLVGTTVGSSGIHHKFGIMILAIRHADGSTRFNPEAHEVIQGPDDCLIAMGETVQLARLETLAASATAQRS